MTITHAFCVAAAAALVAGCDDHHAHAEHTHHEAHRITVTAPRLQNVTVTRSYVGQIHSQRHINVRALEDGYLEAIPIKEGQTVKAGEVMFRVMPALFKARLDAEMAEVQLAKLELANTQRLQNDKVVSENETALFQAKLAKAEAKAALAQAEYNLTEVRAPFDGIVDRLHEQHGSLVKEKDILTTLSDNSTMWVYFNVPEAQYLGYEKAQKGNSKPSRLTLADTKIELILADGQTFDHDAGNTVTVEGQFNHETGNIAFRADFPNPERLLRHGQTGNVQLHRMMKDVLVIPQRATFEILDKQYVFVVDEHHKVHQREITILHETDDVYVIKTGLKADEKIVLDGVRQVRDGQTIEFEFRKPDEVLAHQKKHAE